MKKLILILMLAMPVALMAQTDTLSKKGTEQYCILKMQGKLFTNGVNIIADFGQPTKLFTQRLKDESGKVIDMHSDVDALNFMATQGWRLVQVYTRLVKEGKGDTVYYVMKRELL